MLCNTKKKGWLTAVLDKQNRLPSDAIRRISSPRIIAAWHATRGDKKNETASLDI